MPGMMDTILNLGLNDESVETLAARAGKRFAWDAYRRLIQMYGHVVLGIDSLRFEEVIERVMASESVLTDTAVSPAGWQMAVAEFKKLIEQETDQKFPQDPWQQLKSAIEAVFKSWNNKRAVDYRNATGLPHNLGTAVNVVSMVFGNLGRASSSGVAFTRNPATGEPGLYGEYLINAQGEDVVSGARTPSEIHQLEADMPDVWQAFGDVAAKLEKHYRDMQDLEFTVENGKLWMLQARSGKRTAEAAVKIAVDMVKEGLITRAEAVSRIEPNQIDQLLHPRFDMAAKNAVRLLARGLNASPGAAVGEVCFDADTAEAKFKDNGIAVILVRPETTPDDLHGMIAAEGILTQHGGATSHAAVVARQFGKPCVAGCEEIKIDLKRRQFAVDGRIIKAGDTISLDGTTGQVFEGKIAMIVPSFEEQHDLKTILRWADNFSRLKVWANADTPQQALLARHYGARGIGLCRTEHMFMGERTAKFQEAILADRERCQSILDDILLPLQRKDFYDIFEAMDGLPVIIRLLDPPLHEFLPSKEELLVDVTRLETLGDISDRYRQKKELLSIVTNMEEMNPMLGQRGCRLGLMRPELNQMQVQAIFEAACDAAQNGIAVHPEIMIPLTSHFKELKMIQPVLAEIAEKVMLRKGIRLDYKFGTMIEIPRAALTADELAATAQFFSFGTNDLTQMTFGISRDDAERKFLVEYVKKGILAKNPFQSLDVDGVGQMITMAAEKGRRTRPDLEIGVCGEHGGDPDSINFFNQVGLNYVSCSPYRIPVARLAAGHSALGPIADLVK
jgi:pyruvate,orthophosphate dikinase